MAKLLAPEIVKCTPSLRSDSDDKESPSSTKMLVSPLLTRAVTRSRRGLDARRRIRASQLWEQRWLICQGLQVLDLQKTIGELKERGIGVLITDHNVRETLAVTDRAYIISNGRIFRAGSPESLGNDPEVRRIYLGENFYFAPGLSNIAS